MAKIDEVVDEQIEIKANQGEDSQATSVVDMLLDLEVYQNNKIKLANDLFMGMFAGTDTSRNSTITSLCHLAKNKVSR